jgi:hypothetical protein
MMQIRKLLIAVTTAAVLAGCGGGGNDAPPLVDPLAAVPAEAAQSAPGMVSYLATLAQLLSEAREAIDLTALASMFTSDTTEPEAVQ